MQTQIPTVISYRKGSEELFRRGYRALYESFESAQRKREPGERSRSR